MSALVRDSPMDTGEADEPLLAGRGLVRLAEFCRGTGLSSATVEALIRQGDIEGVVDLNGRAVGVFEDSLPSAEQLHHLGMPVSPGYRPEDLRGSRDDGDHPAAGPVDGGSTWKMPPG
jgi:hypothetical protein